MKKTSWTLYCNLFYIINLYCALNHWYPRHTEIDIHWGLLCFHWKILQQIGTLTNARSVFSIRCKDVLTIFICLLFSFLYLPVLLYAFFAIFVFVTIDIVSLKSVSLKSVRLKHSDCLSHFLELNYRGLSLNFLKLAQLLIDGDVESNPGSTQNDCTSPSGRPKKIRVFQGTTKTFDFSENIIMLMLLVIEKYKMFFSKQNNLSA